MDESGVLKRLVALQIRLGDQPERLVRRRFRPLRLRKGVLGGLLRLRGNGLDFRNVEVAQLGGPAVRERLPGDLANPVGRALRLVRSRLGQADVLFGLQHNLPLLGCDALLFGLSGLCRGRSQLVRLLGGLDGGLGEP